MSDAFFDLPLSYFFCFEPASQIFLEAMLYAVENIYCCDLTKSSASLSRVIPIVTSIGSLGCLPNIMKYGEYPVEL